MSVEAAIAKALEPVIEDLVRLEKADGNSLLDAQAMKALEAGALAVRDYAQSFCYTRTTVETSGASKRLPLWLR